MGYVIVSHLEVEAVNGRVNALRDKGYELHGNMCMTTISNPRNFREELPFYAQVMIKEDGKQAPKSPRLKD
jgi:hypothetical protein